MKLYFIKTEYIVNAERYLDKLKFYYECEYEKHSNEIEDLCNKIQKLENALINAKAQAQGYICRATWSDYSIIKEAQDIRALMDLELQR